MTAIWIAKEFREEHRAALDWLNERTDEHINFFGLEIELWKIGDSPVAPKFNVVCKPNDWSRSVKAGAESGRISEYKQLQFRFWTAFKDYMDKNGKVRCLKPAYQHWMNHPALRPGFYLNSVASLWNSVTNSENPELRVELGLSGKDAKANFTALQQKQTEIEQACGIPLTYYNVEGVATCRIYTRQDADFRREDLWPEQHKWLRQNLELFQKIFPRFVSELMPVQSA